MATWVPFLKEQKLMHIKYPFYKIKKGVQITLNLSKNSPKVIKKFPKNAVNFTIIIKKNLLQKIVKHKFLIDKNILNHVLICNYIVNKKTY